MDEEVKKYHKTSVGGQALIEGIMMRGPKGSAMAVRLPNGEIETTYKNVKPWRDKCKFFGVPLIRGIVGFVESLVTGYGYLMESAEKSTQGLIDLVTGGNLQKFHPLFEGIVRIIIFVAYMALVSRMKDIHRVFMYHGAEHKTIFCYEHGLPLTVENVRKQSRFHPRCGTSFMFVMIILSILLSSALVLIFPGLQNVNRAVWILVKLLVLPLVMGIGYEFIKYAGKHDNLLVKILSAPGLWMQRITTQEPTDDIIEVGIASLEAVITDNPEDDEIK